MPDPTKKKSPSEINLTIRGDQQPVDTSGWQDIPDTFRQVDPAEAGWTDVEPKQSAASRFWNWASTPVTDIISRGGRQVSGALDYVPTVQPTGKNDLQDWAAWADASAKGLFQGSIEGASDLANSFLSPVGMATTALTGGSNVAARAGLGQVARAMQLANRLPSAGMIAHGGSEMIPAAMEFFDPESQKSGWDLAKQFGQGAVEAAGGGLGMTHVPKPQGGFIIKAADKYLPKTTEAILGLKPAAPTPPPTPQAAPGAIPANVPPPTQVVIKGGKGGELAVAKAQQQGFKLVGVKDGNYIMEPPAQAPTPTPTQAATQPTTQPTPVTPTTTAKPTQTPPQPTPISTETPQPVSTAPVFEPIIPGESMTDYVKRTKTNFAQARQAFANKPPTTTPLPTASPQFTQSVAPSVGPEPPSFMDRVGPSIGQPTPPTPLQPSTTPLPTAPPNFQQQMADIAATLPPKPAPTLPPGPSSGQWSEAQFGQPAPPDPLFQQSGFSTAPEPPPTPRIPGEVPYQDSAAAAIQPDMLQGNVPQPPIGGTAPVFGERVPIPEAPPQFQQQVMGEQPPFGAAVGEPTQPPTAKPSFMDSIRRFLGSEEGHIQFGDEEENIVPMAPRARNIEEARAQYQRLETDFQDAVRRGNPDEIESIGQMRDETIDQMAQMNRQRQIEEYNAKQPPIQKLSDIRQTFRPTPEPGKVLPFEQTEAQQRAADETVIKTRGRTEAELTGDEEPQFARVKGGGKVTSNIGNQISELTHGYSGKLPGVMVREGVQNAEDAIKGMPDGKVTVRVVEPKDVAGSPAGPIVIEISDNGKGMSRNDLYTKFVDIHKSGKIGEEGAIGGKGVGAVTYVHGGQHFEISTVRDMRGVKVQSSFGGTPADIQKGFNVDWKVVPPETPTGTTFRVTVDPSDHAAVWARDMARKIAEHSRDRTGQLFLDLAGSPMERPRKLMANDDVIVSNRQIGGGNSSIDVSVPKSATLGERSNIEVNYLNNGYYQFTRTYSIGENTRGVPDQIIVNMRPHVKELSPEYPFGIQRESIKDPLQNEINDVIKKGLVEPYSNKKKADLVKLWAQMPVVSKSPTTGREVVIFDPGDRLTPAEVGYLRKSPVVQQLVQHLDEMIDHMLETTGRPEWSAKVVRVGLTLDPNMHGVHVPNPGAAQAESAIMFNPFIRMSGKGTPAELAMDTVVTGLHESAHVGTDTPTSAVPFQPSDLTDPRVGRYFQEYLNHQMEQGGIDPAHGFPFIKRLGNLFASYGTKNALTAATHLESIFTGGRFTGQYSPEVQRLLRVYEDSRGRPATTEDILSATGVKHADRGPTGPGDVSGAPPADEGGIWIRDPSDMNSIHAALNSGYEFTGEVGPNGAWRFRPTASGVREAPILESEVAGHRPTARGAREQLGQLQVEHPNPIVEAMNLPRALMASGDISAALRQGIGLIHRAEYWRALPEIFRAWGSEEGFNASQQAISERPLFRKRHDAAGNEYNSFAEDAKLALTDLHDLNNREEGFMSTFANKIPGVRASNRAYVAFLNTLRASVFESLVQEGRVFGADAQANLPLAREIAKFTNIASGRGSLGGLESSAGALNALLFSPRLIASRLTMLNPHYYVTASPFVRQQALKSLFAIAAAGQVVTQLGKFAGKAYGLDTSVSADPSSSDFGKLKIGDTRLDPYAGFQQYIVLANRLVNPVGPATGFAGETPFTRGQMVTSTTTGNEYNLQNPQKPFDPTWLSTAGRAAWGKTNPVINFAISLANNSKDMQGQPMNLTSTNPMNNAVAKLFIPLVAQDLYDLAQSDPRLLPLGALAGAGMGLQTYGDAGNQFQEIPQ